MSENLITNAEQFEAFIGESKQRVEILDKRTNETSVLEFDILEAQYLGKLVYVQEHMPRPKLMNPMEVKSGRPERYETPEAMMKRLQEDDYNVYSSLFELLIIWVKGSYPKLKDSSVKKFVFNNIFMLMEAFMKQHSDIDVSDEQTKKMKEFLNKNEASKPKQG